MYRPWGLCQPPFVFQPVREGPAAVKPVTRYRILDEAPRAAEAGPPTARLNPVAAGGQTPASQALPCVGWSLGDLELLAELGRGGMGVVYKAWQRNLDRMVAVKILRSDRAEDPAWLDRFLAEARAVAGLNHAHIVQIYQVGQCAAGPYFAMEFIDGPSLETLIHQGSLSLTRAVTLLWTVTRAVHYAHSRGLLHRDLKPGNILLAPCSRPVLIDFGIARSLGAAAAGTHGGDIAGTPAYMAPEQADEGAVPVGPASDVYSLGAILYTMLTGRPPYVGTSAVRTLLQVLAPEMPPALRTVQPHVPVELERICLKCLHKDPAQRYTTAQALAEDLRRFRTTWVPHKPRRRRRVFAHGSTPTED